MKLMRKDKVMVITGRDKGKKGEIVAVLPKTNQVVIEGINVATKHVKPSSSDPKGGIDVYKRQPPWRWSKTPYTYG